MIDALTNVSSHLARAAEAMSQTNRRITNSQASCVEGAVQTHIVLDGTYQIRQATHTLAKAGSLTTTLDIYDDGADTSGGSSDGQLDTSGIPSTRLLSGGIGHN